MNHSGRLRKLINRSMMIAMAITEHKIIGSINQPPALINSSTSLPQSIAVVLGRIINDLTPDTKTDTSVKGFKLSKTSYIQA